jgi:hypothetical protein
VGVVAEFSRRFRERSTAVRAAETQAAIRRMFAGHPYDGEKLLKQLAELGTKRGAAARGVRPRIVGLIQLAALAGTLLVPMAASAGIVTLDFPTAVGAGGTTGHDNVVADGFRISPSAEYTLVASGGGGSIIDHGIGWDSDGPSNPHFLGSPKPDVAALFVDAGGANFNLLGATFIAQGFDDAFTVSSSKGGMFDVPVGLVGTFDASFASGPEWTDISWLAFSYDDPGAPTAGLDQLVLAVDEPGTLAVFAIALVILCYAGRRRVVVWSRAPRRASTTRSLRF